MDVPLTTRSRHLAVTCADPGCSSALNWCKIAKARAPHAAAASFVANRMRELGILLGTDGPHHNVIKIRPPMPFDTMDADRLIGNFKRILAADFG